MAEDGRVAATLKTTLACAIIASAFGAIAVQAAVAVFVVDKRENLALFITCSVSATLLLLVSAMLGSRGVSKVYRPGYAGQWNADAGKEYFSLQALAGGIGLLLIVISTFLGDPKPEVIKEPADYRVLKSNLEQLQKDVADLKKSKQQTSVTEGQSERSTPRLKTGRH
jgi:hypothetical protein